MRQLAVAESGQVGCQSVSMVGHLPPARAPRRHRTVRRRRRLAARPVYHNSKAIAPCPISAGTESSGSGPVLRTASAQRPACPREHSRDGR